MTILTRLTRLIRADSHHLLDKMEAPDVLLKQSLREMQTHCDQTRQQLDKLERQICHLNHQQQDQQKTIEEQQMHINTAVAADKPELARPLLRRQLEQKRWLDRLGYRRHQLEQDRARIKETLEEQNRRHESIRQQADMLVTRASVESPPGHPVHPGITDAELEAALIQAFKQRRSHS